MSRLNQICCFRRCFFTILMAATILSAGLVKTSLAESKDICRRFTVQPKTFATLKFIGSRQFKEKRLGVYIAFRAKNQTLTIYKYDLGRTRITDDIYKKSLALGIRELKFVVNKLGKSIVGQGKPFYWKIGDVVFMGASFRVVLKNANLTATEYVGLSHNTACLLKLRYTDGSPPQPEMSLKRFEAYARQAHQLFK